MERESLSLTRMELVVFDGCCKWSKGWTRVDVEDRSRPEIVQKLEDITISCAAYNMFYKDIVEQAAGYDDVYYAALDSAFGGYAYGGQPTDGNVLPDSVLRFSYSTVVCAERSVTENIADTLHDGTIRWVTQVRKETYLDTIMKVGMNGVVKRGCIGFNTTSAYTKASADSPTFAKASTGEQRVWLELDECGYGTITRRFFIGNGCGDLATDQVVEQVIHIKPSCAIRLSMMDLPADVGSKEEALCVPNEEAVYDLPVSQTGNAELWPSLAGAICPVVAIGYEDQVSRVTGTDGMYKVRRTWTFMDWCDRDGQMEYVQEIVVRVDPECTNPEVGSRVPDFADGVGVVTRGYGDDYRLYQNHPNPFEGYTVIGFDLPVATEARLTIYDVTGKVLKTVRGDYPKGYHEELIAPGELPKNGVLYYELRTDKYTATQRMVKVKD